jgi:hypothetical protein
VRTGDVAHVFLFRCPGCLGAVTSACFNCEFNLETADEYVFRPCCECGWTEELFGFMAVCHWVHSWEPIAVSAAVGRSQSNDAV